MKSTQLLLLALAASFVSRVRAVDPPSRKLRPVPFTEVRLQDSFWAPKIETNRRKTVPHNIRSCEETGRISNFAKAGGKEPGEFKGICFDDSDVYKMLEGASYTLALRPDRDLEEKLDEIIAKLAAAQQPDGYLNTYYTLVEKGKRWTDLPNKHELYCAGHLFEAAVAHHGATGKRTLLDVARRFADHIDRTFGPGKKSGVPGHEEIELALVKLYEATREERYLKLAGYFVDERGRHTDRKPYGDYCQDHLPVREQSEIAGHAVRAMYLYSGVADVAAYTGDRALVDAMERLWRDVTQRKMYVTGGIGPSAHNEGFTVEYDLPNQSAYSETCASIGMALWNQRLFLLHGDGRYSDVLEQVLYNALLAGVALDGERFFYVNPLASRGRHHRQPWFGCACCPTNVVRFLPSVPGYFYASSDDGVWVNLYGASETVVAFGPRGRERRVTVRQETEYPWSGRVVVRVEPEGGPLEMSLRLRVPAWCAAPRYRVGGGAFAPAAAARGFLEVRREWGVGDSVELDLPMDVQRLETHPAVKGNQGRVALRRGPVIYCLEAADNGGSAYDLALPRDEPFETVHRPDLLGGVTVLKGHGVRARLAAWEGRLYRSVADPEKVEVTAVPYCVWDNREPGPMAVWIPESAGLAQAAPAPTLASRSKVAASHVWRLDTVESANDQVLPSSSSDHGVPRFTWFDRKGSKEWIEYRFPAPAEVRGVAVYWFDDTGTGQCRVPASWRVLSRKGDAWEPVEGASAFGVAKDAFNRVTFRPVRADGLRIEAQLAPDASGGILEWRVLEGAGG
ncbi:MAG: glycoside hydrolase family 127 protein [Planctomycetes bacterium]|nr:glycoside hydrolase family 127 protein [Planctomycetota bacterium]